MYAVVYTTVQVAANEEEEFAASSYGRTDKTSLTVFVAALEPLEARAMTSR